MWKNRRENPRSCGHKSRTPKIVTKAHDDDHTSKQLPHLPPDVIWDIFVLLPANSLIRVRAVCTAWRSVIDDPLFARAHFKTKQNNNNTILIRTSSTAPPFAPYYSVDLAALSPHSNCLQTIPATPAGPAPAALIGTCHGLIFDENFEIYNPLFPNNRLKLHFTLPIDPAHKVVGGFGYDHATDDYKAVVIYRGTRGKTHPAFPTYVYSLRSDSKWRAIRDDCPCDRWGVWGPGLYLNGALHWMGVSEIFALDLRTEKYRKLKMPRFWKSRVDVIFSERDLDVLDGCLVVTDFSKDDFFSLNFDAWVLRRGSWTKLFSLSHYGYFGIDKNMRPVAYMKNKTHIFMHDRKNFYLVDPKRGRLRRVSIRGLTAGKLSAQPFQETLFRPKDICGVVGGGQRRMTVTVSSPTEENKPMKICNTELIFSFSYYDYDY